VPEGFALQFAASLAAVALLVGLAAWAKISKPMTPLDDARALKLLGEEFPGRRVERIWVAVDGRGALAKSGAAALVLCEVGDGYVARHIPWAQAISSSFRDGVVKLDLSDVAAPNARIALESWPPSSTPPQDQRAA
jgi:CTP:molybdopterin cytidylyltransferase MocA